MSELIKDDRASLRWKLLTGASAFALVASSAGIARAENGDHPVLWIELGGQADRVDEISEIFKPVFFDHTPAADLTPMLAAQRPSPFSLGEQAKITFEPERTNWVFSVAVHYGKSSAARHEQHQTLAPSIYQYFGTQIIPQPANEQFGDGQSSHAESHLILDFTAGKDVGLGMFGSHGSSVISGGVRFAQFTSRSDATFNARPYYGFGAVHSGHRQLYRSYPYPHYITAGYRTVEVFRHTYAATLHTKRNSQSVGPTVSWDASLPVLGNSADMTFNVDWGLNAAVLFGRQRAQIKHKTSGSYYSRTGGLFKYHDTKFGGYTRGNVRRTGGYVHGPHYRTVSRRVTIPNVGGFVGMSMNFPNAKVSLGYRADLFFNAMDGGIDARKSENVSFYGPFASVSIGLGG